MKTVVLLALFALFLVAPRDASAVCGDLTGDDKTTVADALAALRKSVGQNVDLICIDTTPSRIRYFNGIDCNSADDTSTLEFHDADENYFFEAEPGESSAYQVVDDTMIDDIEIDLCGGTYTFTDPFHLAPNHSYELFMVLVDPDIYGEDQAYAILYDMGEPVVAGSASAAAATAAAEPVFIVGTLQK